MHDFGQSHAGRLRSADMSRSLIRDHERPCTELLQRLLVDRLAPERSDAISNTGMKDREAETTAAADVVRPGDHARQRRRNR